MAQRNELVKQLGLSIVPLLFSCSTTIDILKFMVVREKSQFRPGSLEGMVVRRENQECVESRAKLIHPDFTQSISEHWSRRGILWNQCRIR